VVRPVRGPSVEFNRRRVDAIAISEELHLDRSGALPSIGHGQRDRAEGARWWPQSAVPVLTAGWTRVCPAAELLGARARACYGPFTQLLRDLHLDGRAVFDAIRPSPAAAAEPSENGRSSDRSANNTSEAPTASRERDTVRPHAQRGVQRPIASFPQSALRARPPTVPALRVQLRRIRADGAWGVCPVVIPLLHPDSRARVAVSSRKPEQQCIRLDSTRLASICQVMVPAPKGLRQANRLRPICIGSSPGTRRRSYTMRPTPADWRA